MTEAMQLTCFKAYDIRAKLGAELNEDIAYRIGRSVAQVLQTTHVVIGYDARETSPTLANAMQSQAQQAARERQSQMTPGEPSSSEGSTPSTESGSGMQMPDGGTVDISKTERAGTEWGKLRERRTEDASESRGESIAPQYRREIEAYFRAIATRAAEKSE